MIVEDVHAGDAQLLAGADQEGAGDDFLAGDGAEVVDLQLRSGGAALAVAVMTLDGVPGGFIGDGGGNAAVQDAVVIEIRRQKIEVNRDAISVFARDTQVELVLEGHGFIKAHAGAVDGIE